MNLYKKSKNTIMPFLSIVIPTMNRPDYLKFCLKSLHNHVRHNKIVEVTVIDDFSEVNNYNINLSICNIYGFTCIRHNRNLGIAAARNTGAQNSKGKWIVFLDDDIRVNEFWLSNLLSLLPNLPKEIIGVEGKVECSGDGIWDKEVQNIHGNKYLTCNYCLKKEVLDLVGGFDPYFIKYCDDHEITARILPHGKIIFAPNISVTHLPKNVPLIKYILSSRTRICTLLDSEYRFYEKNPDQYCHFRVSNTFWGTYSRIIQRNIINNIRRRSVNSIVKHPIQFLVLVFASIIEQVFSVFMIPHFLRLKMKSKQLTHNNANISTKQKELP